MYEKTVVSQGKLDVFDRRDVMRMPYSSQPWARGRPWQKEALLDTMRGSHDWKNQDPGTLRIEETLCREDK